MKGVAEGYRYFQESSPTFSGAFEGDSYINSIVKEIDELSNGINKFEGFNTNDLQLKGNIAEFWHSGTHNIDSAVKGMKTRTSVNSSNEFASADISSSTGEEFGLKYYADGISSSKAQAKSYFERYNEYRSSSNADISFDEYLDERNINTDDVLVHDPIYSGQIRIIPKDQMDEAIGWLQKKIASEQSIRPEQVERYQETLRLLKDAVETEEGATSIPISANEAERLAKLAKEGEFDPSKYNLTTEELVSFRLIMQQSVQAGLTAATISLVLKVAPQVYKSIEYLIQNGEIDEKQLKQAGFAALSGFSAGFVRGTVAAALTSSFKSGIFGQSLKSIDPPVIGAVTVIFMNVMKNSCEVACGRMSNREMINEMIKDMYISAFALTAGGITQSIIEIPVLGYMLGSFVGAMVGGITYEYGYSKLISFCVESGFTVFGLVDQDYRLPEEVIEQLGFDLYELDQLVLDEYKQDEFELDSFDLDEVELDEIQLVFVRRGVIGFNRIGYI